MDGRKTSGWHGNLGEAESSARSSESTSAESYGENGLRDRSGSIEGSQWTSVIEKFIDQVEEVSSHFGYTEEYVLDHSIDWLHRKYRHSMKQQWERSQSRVIEGYKSISLVLDGILNGGKGMKDLLPSTFEEAIEQSMEKKEDTSKFITSQWWKKSEE